MAITTAGVAIAGMAASAAGGVISGLGAKYQGEAESNKYQYLAGVAQANEKIAAQNASWETMSGEVEAQQAGLKSAAERGASKVAAAAGNISTTTGSSAEIGKSITEIGQQNQAIIRASAAKRAYGAEVEGFEQSTQAGLYQTAAQTSKTQGDINELASWVGGAGNVSSKWIDYSKSFPTSTSTGYGGLY